MTALRREWHPKDIVIQPQPLAEQFKNAKFFQKWAHLLYISKNLHFGEVLNTFTIYFAEFFFYSWTNFNATFFCDSSRFCAKNVKLKNEDFRYKYRKKKQWHIQNFVTDEMWRLLYWLPFSILQQRHHCQ